MLKSVNTSRQTWTRVLLIGLSKYLTRIQAVGPVSSKLWRRASVAFHHHSQIEAQGGSGRKAKIRNKIGNCFNYVRKGQDWQLNDWISFDQSREGARKKSQPLSSFSWTSFGLTLETWAGSIFGQHSHATSPNDSGGVVNTLPTGVMVEDRVRSWLFSDKGQKVIARRCWCSKDHDTTWGVREGSGRYFYRIGDHSQKRISFKCRRDRTHVCHGPVAWAERVKVVLEWILTVGRIHCHW